MGQRRQANTSKGRKYDPLGLRRTSATRRDGIAFSLNHRYDSFGGAAGTNILTQSQIAELVATLTTADAGLEILVTDFRHTLFWDGSGLDFKPGDHGSNYFVDAPSAPLGLLAGLCDGSTYTYLKGDGSLGSYTTKNLSGHYRKSVTTGADAVQSPIAPGLSGSTAVASTGLSAGLTGSTAVASTGVTLDPHSTATDTTVTGAGTRLTGPIAHTVTDPQHAHAKGTLAVGLTDPTHAHGKGTLAVDATAEPEAYLVLTYFVR